MGRGRQIPKSVCERKEKVFVHRSVKTRMDAAADCLDGEKYIPKANFEHYGVEWVDSNTCRQASRSSIPVRSFGFIYASSSASLLVLFWYLTASRPLV
jgi:hypothetical protein